MEMVIALGGNIGDRECYLELASKEIQQSIGTIKKRSRWYETEPLLDFRSPIANQPKYLNGAILLETELIPEETLKALLGIEKDFGRVRGINSPRWAPRTVDLDLISAESTVIESPHLSLPHREMHRRLFVLQPMAEICPFWKHPLLDKTVLELLDILLKEEQIRPGSPLLPART